MKIYNHTDVAPPGAWQASSETEYQLNFDEFDEDLISVEWREHSKLIDGRELHGWYLWIRRNGEYTTKCAKIPLPDDTPVEQVLEWAWTVYNLDVSLEGEP